MSFLGLGLASADRRAHFQCAILTREKVVSSRGFVHSSPRVAPYVETLVIKYTSLPDDGQVCIEQVDLYFL